MQGPEDAYAEGEKIARDIWAPVTRVHRITLEQMAILEPTMAETCGMTLIAIARKDGYEVFTHPHRVKGKLEGKLV